MKVMACEYGRATQTHPFSEPVCAIFISISIIVIIVDMPQLRVHTWPWPGRAIRFSTRARKARSRRQTCPQF